MQSSHLVERALITYVARLVDSGQLEPRIRNKRDFANIAFPDKGEKLWKALRRGNTGKPQTLTLEHIYGMAAALGISAIKLIARAEVMVEDGWSLEDDIKNEIVTKGRKPTQKKTDAGTANKGQTVAAQ